jgi:hypothetical protein
MLTDGIDSGRGTSFDAELRIAPRGQAAVYVVSNTGLERARKLREFDSLSGASNSAVRFNQPHKRPAALDASERNIESLTRSTGGTIVSAVFV